jgi:amino acid adenylation domain-containing protein
MGQATVLDQPEVTTLGALFVWRCQQQPQAAAYVQLDGGLHTASSLTYSELLQRVMALAHLMRTRAIAGDRVLVAYPPGLDFQVAFWACMVCGLVAVPVPEPVGLGATWERFLGVARNAQCVGLLCTEALQEAASAVLAGVWIGSETGSWLLPPSPTPTQNMREGKIYSAVAYLQYTSGSTGDPRGVMLSHTNVLAHCAAAVHAVHLKSSSRVLSWLPYFHDYGLVMGVVVPLYVGVCSYVMSHQVFLRRPLRWLEAVGKLHITHTGAPHFAYAVCMQALVEQPDWSGDLGSLISLSCGAEPIAAQTVAAFQEAFGAHGLKTHVFAPAYGLAEAVLAVTTTPPDTPACIATLDAAALEAGVAAAALGAARVRQVVGCGWPIADTRVVIASTQTLLPAEKNTVGEIWVQGTSVGMGYWDQAQTSADTFGALLAGGDSKAPYLRTGDLGYLGDDGQLFVTGRCKDVIIIHGRNHFPSDIEHSMQSVGAAVQSGRGAAFSIELPQIDQFQSEALVVVQEVVRGTPVSALPGIGQSIMQILAQQHGLAAHAVVLVRARSLPRTSSGKVQRYACKAAYLSNALQVLEPNEKSNINVSLHSETEHTLARIWQEVLQRPVSSAQAHFFALGGHSLRATQVASRVREHMGVSLSLDTIFDAPVLRNLAAVIESLGKTQDQPLIPIARLVRSGQPMVVSSSQLRMWLIQQLNPHNTAYNIPFTVHMRGILHKQHLAQALTLTAQQHEAFRTRFAMVGKEPMQTIETCTPDNAMVVVDLQHVPEHQRQTQLHQQLAKLCMQPFDLAQAGLHRIALFQLGPTEHVLIWLLHHIICDQWSGGVLLHSVKHAYVQLCAGQAVAVAAEALARPDRLEYADYAAWQRKTEHLPAHQQQLAYWSGHLRGITPLNLPWDYPPQGLPSGRGASVTQVLGDATRRAIAQTSEQHGVTPFMLLLACFQILLWRYTGQTDIAVGSPIANRHHLASEDLVGTLVNTLVMRTSLEGEPLFTALLARVKHTALQAYAHQDTPFETLVDTLHGAREQRHAPLVQVLFNMLNAPLAVEKFGDLQLSHCNFDRGSAQFDLSLSVDIDLFGTLHLEYSRDRFAQPTAQRFLGQFHTLLKHVLADPQQPIGHYRVISGTEQALLKRWGSQPSTLTSTLPCQRIDQLIAAAPHHPSALQSSDRSLSTQALQDQSNQLAHALRQRGIQRGALVGLCLERSVMLVVAQLAVLKAGAAWVPLDPGYPAQRLAVMATDAQLALLITDSHCVDALVWPRNISLLLDIDSHLISAQPCTPLLPDPSLDAQGQDPAYVIYTSGSTGKPKGVAVPHRAVVNFLTSMARQPGLCSQDKLLAITTVNFDIAVLELWLPLATGAQVVLASRQAATHGPALRALLESTQANTMQATPTTWQMLLDAGWQGHPQFKVLVGGESLSPRLAHQLLQCAGQVWNMYGPTETTVWSSCWQVQEPDQGIFIGNPIANTTLHVMASDLTICPIGVTGELCIGGAGLANGYLHQPQLTAQRFVTSAQGERLYRTGDVARWHASGLLEHLGRCDQQIKLRGHRIEPGDIEAAVATHPEVLHSCVMLGHTTASDARLIAFVVPRAQAPHHKVLRQHLRALLPEHMVPQQFITLAHLPLLPNGKIDRNTLLSTPEIRDALDPTEQPRLQPGTPEEITIAGIWSALLGPVVIGTQDNFFDLGGHSLLAMHAAMAIEKSLGTKIDPRRLIFENLAQLAQGCGSP